MQRVLFFFFLVSSVLFAQDALSPPPAIFTPKEVSHYIPQLPKVNVITGEYCEEACDIEVAGAQPLSYRRFYGHLGHKDEALGHWRANPECQVLFNFAYTGEKHKYSKLLGVGEEDGSFYIYDKIDNNIYFFNAEKHRCFTHTTTTGQDHPLNISSDINQFGKGHDIQRFYYAGTLRDGSGRERVFRTPMRSWPRDKKAESDISVKPPYLAYISDARMPNGNYLVYEYQNYNDKMLHDTLIPPYFILKSIKAYNAQKTILLGSLDINYERASLKRNRRIRNIYIKGSDGREGKLCHKIREVKSANKKVGIAARYDVVLKQTDIAWKPEESYNYRWDNSKHYYDALFMFEASYPGRKCLITEYDLKNKKVSEQKAPVGPNGEMYPITRYDYQDKHTIVHDGENNKTIYRFNEDQRITAIEKYEGKELYSTEKNTWDSRTGNLLRKSVEDNEGKLFKVIERIYDKNQNVIEEKIGDGTTYDIIYRTFTQDGFNLIATETNGLGKLTAYTYVPRTNLLASELVYLNDQLSKRTFHFYDTELNSVCIKTIIDDGKTLDPTDLSEVTYRKIIEILPKRTLPCLGLPEEILEKTINSYGKEILLKKVCYTYHPSGKVIREDHYDAKGEYAYSLINTYDEQERLKESIDALGSKTTFAYDVNFNLITEVNPLGGCKEWTYDKVNRPIQEKRWHEGESLIREMKYDKASRLIEIIDEYGFETRYSYDSLGRVIATCYPDGAIEKKEYDPLGNITKEIDPKGYATTREYNFRGQVTAIHFPDGTRELFIYNQNSGILAKKINSDDTFIIYAYDLFDRPLKIETFTSDKRLLKKTSAIYSTFQKISETDALGITTTYTYDFAGRKITEIKADKKLFFFYDSLGRENIIQENDALFITEYDYLGLPIEKRREDFYHSILTQERYHYDAQGNLTRTITSKGITETLYNSLNLPILKRDPLGYETSFSYSYKGGFITTIRDPHGVETIHIYNSRGKEVETIKKNSEIIQKVQRTFDTCLHLIEETHLVFKGSKPQQIITHFWEYGPCNRLERFVEAGQKETLYTYDSFGRLKEIIKPDKTLIFHDYDALGRLLHFFSKDFEYTYTYDANDQILSVSDSHTTTTRSYDALGNITHETLSNGLALFHLFDAYGKKLQSHFPDHSTVEYAYTAHFLDQVFRKGYSYRYLSRDLEGTLTQAELPSNLGTLSIERDGLSRWKRYTSPYFSAEYLYDGVGNLTSYHYTDHLGSQNCRYAHDDLKQLTRENEHTYLFDSLYNRLQKDDLCHAINALCQTLHDGTTEYLYDANGNLISDGTSHFTYDSLDRLISIHKGTQQIKFTYDPFHRRLSKSLFEKGKLIKKIDYLYDGQNEIGAFSLGKPEELRILGEGLGAEIGAALFIELKDKIYTPLHDHRGSVVTLLDLQTKQISATYRYTAFGEESTNGILSPWRFASKRIDPETQWVYFGRRYYAPSLGKWTTPDPQGFQDGPNLYAYVHNSPLLDYDLYGLWSWGGVWNGTKGFGLGACKALYGMGYGMGYSMAKMGEWMHADFQYEYFNDRSFFYEKAYTATDEWKALGKAAWDDPLGMVAPGIMDAWRNPTNPEAWGNAAVDIGMLSFSGSKFGRAASFRKAAHIGEEFATFGKARKVSIFAKEVSLLKKKTAEEAMPRNTTLFKKGGPSRDPITQNYLPDPAAQGSAHTTLGIRKGRQGSYKQGATFDNQGIFRGRTDVTNHGRYDHFNPHFHPARSPNSVEGGAHLLPDFNTDPYFILWRT